MDRQHQPINAPGICDDQIHGYVLDDMTCFIQTVVEKKQWVAHLPIKSHACMGSFPSKQTRLIPIKRTSTYPIHNDSIGCSQLRHVLSTIYTWPSSLLPMYSCTYYKSTSAPTTHLNIKAQLWSKPHKICIIYMLIIMPNSKLIVTSPTTWS